MEVDMSRYDFDLVEPDEGDQKLESNWRRFAIKHVDQPRLSPMRRKNKLLQDEEIKPKAKRNHKKIQHKIKYDWQNA